MAKKIDFNGTQNPGKASLMLIVRTAQLKIFEKVMIAQFVSDLASEFIAEFPRRVKQLGADGVRTWIHHGIARAATYDITGVEAVARYIRLMFIFGRDFDVCPDFPWISALLADSATSQDAKVNELTDRLSEYVTNLLAIQSAA